MIRLGPQLYTVRDFMQSEEGIENTFAVCHEKGYETVQLSANKYIPADRMKALTDRYQIHVCATHSPLERMKNDLDQLIEEHKEVGVPVIGLGSMPAEYTVSAAKLREFTEMMAPIAHKIKQAGLQFAYHNHCTEFHRLDDGKWIFDHLLEDTDPDEFHFIPETYWLQIGGVDPARFIRTRLKGRVEVCHFKDLAIEDFKPVFAEVGEGNLDLADCFRACMEIGVKAIVIEEDVCPRDPFDCLENSYRNLEKIARLAGDR